ncbi:MAG: DHA2 family efflux MFS transporter permease subunit [Ilumatobacteraceae bacterium]
MNPSAHRDGAVAIGDYDGIDPHVYERRWKTLAVLCTSLMIVIIGNTVLNVALPTMSRPDQLGASNTELQWIVDAYALVFAGLLFTAGALGDRFGRKGALQLGLVVFGLGSLFGALSDSSGQVIAARAIMGVGAAFVMPSTLSILTNVFPTRERARAIALWAGISGSGAALGPIASGLLLEHFWWGSVFLVNIPIIVLALVAGWVFVPKSKDSTASPLDPIGAVLSIVGLSALVYAIIEGPHHGWLSTASIVWFSFAAVVLVGFCFWELRNRHPMLDLHLFQNPRFAVSSGGITLVFFAMFGTFFMLAQYLQGVLQYSPLGAAVRLLPMSFVMMAVAPQTPKLVAKFGADKVGATGLSFVGVGLIGVAFFQVDTPYIQLVITMCVLAAGMSMTMTPMTTQLMASVPRDRAGMGSATNDTTRELGGALGVAVLGSLLASQYTAGMADAVAGLPSELQDVAESSIGGALGLAQQGLVPQSVVDVARSSFVDGLSLAAATGAVLVLLAAIAVKRYLPSDKFNAEITGEPVAAPVAGD